VPDIHIERQHSLGLSEARTIARQWMRRTEESYGLAWSYDEGEAGDVARFTRAGIDGAMEVGADRLALRATLGAFYGSFAGLIEERLRRKLDELLQREAEG